ncbi:hypothetical protein WN943_005862 [Citrus x changshan-huyou]
MNCWPIRQLDVNNAFLNGMLTEDVFMPQPEGFINSQFPNHVCKLQKALYDLKQAPRAWYDRLKGSLVQWGFRSSKSNTSLFLKHVGCDVLVILVYVDDILITASSNAQVTEVISQLSSEFALKDLGDFNYFLGVEVTPSAEGLHLSQTKYVGDILRKAHMLGSKGCNTPISVTDKLQKDKGCIFENHSLYRSIISSLPVKECYDSCKVQHILDFSSSSQDLQLSQPILMQIEGLIQMTGGMLEGTVALALATSEILWITYLLKELKVSLTKSPVLYCNNKSAEALASNPKYHSRTKHIELDLHFVREHIANKELRIEHVSSSDQLADVLTKPLGSDHFAYMRTKLNLIVTLVYFILAEIHAKNNFSVLVFPLVFAVIIAVFTLKNDGGASDSSGHADDDLFGDPLV